jgi:type I restriction enzyme R subunit
VNRPYEDDKGVKKPCGLVIDFIGVLKELNKALAFDSDEVSSVIEDLDVLFARFKELMAAQAQAHPPLRERTAAMTRSWSSCFTRHFWIMRNGRSSSNFSEKSKRCMRSSPLDLNYATTSTTTTDSPTSTFCFVMPTAEKTQFIGDIAHKTEILVRENANTFGPSYYSSRLCSFYFEFPCPPNQGRLKARRNTSTQYA